MIGYRTNKYYKKHLSNKDESGIQSTIFVWQGSSVGQSMRFIPAGSGVQFPPLLPIQNDYVHYQLYLLNQMSQLRMIVSFIYITLNFDTQRQLRGGFAILICSSPKRRINVFQIFIRNISRCLTLLTSLILRIFIKLSTR